MPLTTRPSLTSRHGTILRASMRDLRGLYDGEAPVVQRATDDDRRDAGVAQPNEIGKLADAARRDHLAGDRALELRRQLDVRPDAQAVACDVGVEQRGRAPSAG